MIAMSQVLIIKYRKNCIKPAVERNNISNMQNLAISNIFPINKIDPDSCITKFSKLENARGELHELAYQGIHLERATFDASGSCKDIAVSMQPVFQPNIQIDVLIRDCCLSFKENCCSIPLNSETTFIDKYLRPVLIEILTKTGQKNYIYGYIDAKNDNGKMPDFKLGIMHKKKARYAFFVEAKRLKETSIYQAKDDYVKLMKMMKTCIDMQVKLGLKDPASFGLLCEDHKLSMVKISFKYE